MAIKTNKIARSWSQFNQCEPIVGHFQGDEVVLPRRQGQKETCETFLKAFIADMATIEMKNADEFYFKSLMEHELARILKERGESSIANAMSAEKTTARTMTIENYKA